MAMMNNKSKPPITFRALEKVKVRPQSLVQICLKRVAQNFLTYDSIEKKLGKKQLEDVYAMLDLDMFLPIAATRISDENYWRRRTQAKHRNAQVEKHGMSWKQTFLELELQQALERLPICPEDQEEMPELEEVKHQVNASRLHIFQLQVGEFSSHIDLSFLFDALPALCSFSITYGSRHLGMDYERAMFGMKISDAQFLARNIRVSQTLVSLALPCNMIDDELVKVVMGGLIYAHMLTHLDLSHNKIGDRGARRLASLLDPDYCISTLDLSDNQIHANGCMHLGAHLADNTTCTTLNLRLNRCEDNGVSHLFQDICVNAALKVLNLSCNDLTMRCLPYMNSMLSENKTLIELDLSGNTLYQVETDDQTAAPTDNAQQNPPPSASAPAPAETAETPGLENAAEDALAGLNISGQFGVFVRTVMRNEALLRVDIRQCGIPPEAAKLITTTVKHRELKTKGIPIDAYERGKVDPKAEEEEELENPQEEDGGGEGLGEVAEGADGEAQEGGGEVAGGAEGQDAPVEEDN